MALRILLDFLQDPKGLRYYDKLILFLAKFSYVLLHVVARLIIGKARRNRLFKARALTWLNFLPPRVREIRLLAPFGYTFIAYPSIPFTLFTHMTGELELRRSFAPKEGETVIDVGANVGAYTLLAAKLVGENGRVVALEPEPINFNLLKRNIEINGFKNVILLQLAAWNKDGSAVMEIRRNIADHTLSPQFGSTEALFQMEVQTARIDSLTRKIGIRKVDWLKVDVEGAEYEVLMGCRNLLASSRAHVLIEVHLPEVLEPIINLLKKLGYQIYRMPTRYKQVYIFAQKNN